MSQQSYLDFMRGLWEGDSDHLVHRVGANQFDTETITWYYDHIFAFTGLAFHPSRLKPFPTTGSGLLRILDYGCGVGRLAIPLSKMLGPAAVVYGVDISPDMVNEANRRAVAKDARRAVFSVVPGAAFEPPGGQVFDAAYSVITLQHICSISTISAIIESMAKCLRPEGALILQVKQWRPGLRPWNYEVPESGIPEPVVNIGVVPENLMVEEGNAFTDAEISALCSSYGIIRDSVLTSEAIDDHGNWLWFYGHKDKSHGLVGDCLDSSGEPSSLSR